MPLQSDDRFRILQNIDEAGIYRCGNAPQAHLPLEASHPDIWRDTELPPVSGGRIGLRWERDGHDYEPRSQPGYAHACRPTRLDAERHGTISRLVATACPWVRVVKASTASSCKLKTTLLEWQLRRVWSPGCPCRLCGEWLRQGEGIAEVVCRRAEGVRCAIDGAQKHE